MTQVNETYSVETAKVIGSVINSFLDEQAALVDKYRVIIAEKFMSQELTPEDAQEIVERLGLVNEGPLNEDDIDDIYVPESIEEEDEESELYKQLTIDNVIEAKLEADITPVEEVEDELTMSEEVLEQELTVGEPEYQISEEQDMLLHQLFNNFKDAINDPSLTFTLSLRELVDIEGKLFDSGLFPVYTTIFTSEGLQFTLTPAIIGDQSIEETDVFKHSVTGTELDLSLPASRFEFMFSFMGVPEGLLLKNKKNEREAILVEADQEALDEVRLLLVDVQTGKERNWALRNVVEADASEDIIDAMGQEL